MVILANRHITWNKMSQQLNGRITMRPEKLKSQAMAV